MTIMISTSQTQAVQATTALNKTITAVEELQAQLTTANALIEKQQPRIGAFEAKRESTTPEKVQHLETSLPSLHEKIDRNAQQIALQASTSATYK